MHTCKCSDCEHTIFDQVWGEYKCKKFKHRIYDIEKVEECEGYEKKKKNNKT